MSSGNLIAFYIPGELAFNERLLGKKIESNVIVDTGTVFLSRNLFSFSSLQQFGNLCRILRRMAMWLTSLRISVQVICTMYL